MNLHEVLSSTFGHEAFRPYQEPIIRAVMDGQDVLGVLPTGAGKSLCYQLPALLLPRPTLVVSPLIALMKDQLDGLPPAVYPKATLINSSIDPDELDRRLQGMEEGRYKLIYVAPERLRQGSFLRRLGRMGLSLVVVDEAHCVSVWGHDFRPDYLFIRRALDALGMEGAPPQVLALTATATPEMQGEIARQLGRPLEGITAPVFRNNLRLEVHPCRNADEKMRRLEALCREIPGAAIVYVNSREGCEKIAAFLRRGGLPAMHYHAGMGREERQQAQERFMLDRVRIIVATVAFGMGVDKPNVRLVAHMNLPHSLEAYSQEAGRAGRDGKPSRCALLYAASDKASLNRWMRQEEIKLETVRDVYRALQSRLGRGAGSVSPEEIQAEVFGPEGGFGADSQLRVAISLLEKSGMVSRQPDAGRDMQVAMLPPPPSARADLEALLDERRRHAEARLEEVVAYAEEPGCRHVALSRHFEQAIPPCGSSCDDCLGTREEIAPAVKPDPPTADAVPDLGRVILETTLALPFPVGRTGLAKVLSGAADSPVKRDRCEPYGLLAGFTLKALRGYMDRLLEEGLLRIPPGDEYNRLFVTPDGQAALEGEETIIANPFREPSPSRSASRSSSRPALSSAVDMTAPPSEDEDDLFERLRAWRRIEVQRAGLPPYVIFHDATLRMIARACPATVQELESLPGIGGKKIESYGAAVLALIRGEEPDDSG
ncbi:MAG: ATP-dependent DNA helicase [Armatimonadetes bacterium]|nr:ATP-dependent DNA helicase [Armatimonadota bacterium]